jgi:hypothetical protein
MPLPARLEDARKSALDAVRDDSRGHLDRPHRQRLYREMGAAPDAAWHRSRFAQANNLAYAPGDDAAPPTAQPGHTRRAQLAQRTVRQVLPVWQGIWPDEHWPEELLAHAQRATTGSPEEIRAAYVEWRNSRPAVDDYYGDHDGNQHPAAMCVLEAAMCALICAIFDEHADPSGERVILDSDTDYTSWDAAYYCAIAVSGKAPDDAADPGSVALRRAFWRWWLDEAVPAALASDPLHE